MLLDNVELINKIENENYRMVFCILVYLTYIYWFFGMFMYGLKFVIESYNKLTTYGKLIEEQKAPMLSFHHKYGWTLFYSFSFLWTLIVASLMIYFQINILEKPLYYSDPTWIILTILYLTQSFRRAYECIFIHKFSNNYMILLNFIAGISFYAAVSMSLLEQYFIVNYENKMLSRKEILLIIIGISLFCISSYFQQMCHKHLRSLRVNQKDHNSKKKKYYIPNHKLFQLISSPHYLFEILIYLSYVLISNANGLAINLAFLFVLINLTNNSYQTHKWYKSKFKDYPKQRSALIPFII